MKSIENEIRMKNKEKYSGKIEKFTFQHLIELNTRFSRDVISRRLKCISQVCIDRSMTKRESEVMIKFVKSLVKNKRNRKKNRNQNQAKPISLKLNLTRLSNQT